MLHLARRKLTASETMLPLRFFHYCVFASFLFLYLVLVHYCQTHYYRDPTSAFFDPNRGYDQIYSKFRTAQANNFIREADAIASPVNKSSLPTNTKASLCVGISSVKRQGVNYFESAVGSLLLELTEREREDIHLVLFIPHTDPKVHPSYSSSWLSATADTVLLYDLPEDQMKHLKFLESKSGPSLEKSLFDYTYLLKACQAVGSPYTVLVEDDVVAMDGWYHRTRQALEDAERQTRDMGASKYLYLRLFYTQKFLGWNSEEWFIYFSCSLFIIASVGAAFVVIRHFLSQTSRFIPNRIIAVFCLIGTPLCIILFFFAGRVSMLPPSAGVHQMPEFGCCSQALAFPHERVMDVIEWYESQQEGNADTLLETYADAHDEIRWALTPSLFQHIGVISTKYEDNGERRNAKSIWNYLFELNDPVALQLEHEMVAESENKAN